MKGSKRLAQRPDEPLYIVLNDTGKARQSQDRYGYSGGYYHDKDQANHKGEPQMMS
jgi:hypothetical protein